MYEMLITDMDQTFLDDRSEASLKNIESVKKIKSAGLKFAIATGRSRKSLERVLVKYNIYSYVDYMITLNGVAFYDRAKKKEYSEKFLKKETILSLVNEFAGEDVSAALYSGNDNFYCSRVEDEEFIVQEIYNYRECVRDDFKNLINTEFPKLMFVGKKEILDKVQKRLSEMSTSEFNFFRSLDTYLEIVSPGVSKGEMLKKLCSNEGIEISRVAAVGDNMNDLEMIEAAGTGIAVANAHEMILERADIITKSNNESGFSEACEYVLKHIKREKGQSNG